jgi:hypothetical protein
MMIHENNRGAIHRYDKTGTDKIELKYGFLQGLKAACRYNGNLLRAVATVGIGRAQHWRI